MKRYKSDASTNSYQTGSFCSEKKIGLTKKDKLGFMLSEMSLTASGYSGRIEIHIVNGSIRNIVKVETINLTD